MHNSFVLSKKQNGITLIALIITVILLLILAGVVLNLTLGERGIFTIAKNASKNFMDAQNKELSDLEKLYSELKIATNDGSQVSVNIEDLKQIIQNEVTDNTKELQSEIQALKDKINTLDFTSVAMNGNELYNYDTASTNNKADKEGIYSFTFPEGKTLADYKYLYFLTSCYDASIGSSWINQTSTFTEAKVNNSPHYFSSSYSWGGTDCYSFSISIPDAEHFRIDFINLTDRDKARVYKVIGIY